MLEDSASGSGGTSKLDCGKSFGLGVAGEGLIDANFKVEGWDNNFGLGIKDNWCGGCSRDRGVVLVLIDVEDWGCAAVVLLQGALDGPGAEVDKVGVEFALVDTLEAPKDIDIEKGGLPPLPTGGVGLVGR